MSRNDADQPKAQIEDPHDDPDASDLNPPKPHGEDLVASVPKAPHHCTQEYSQYRWQSEFLKKVDGK